MLLKILRINVSRPRKKSVEGRQFVSRSLKPSQPQRITSGLNTNFNLFPSYSFHKSLYHQSFFLQTKAQILFTMSDIQKDNKSERARERERERDSWCFEPSQPQRITSGLQTDRYRHREKIPKGLTHCLSPRRLCPYHLRRSLILHT